MITALGSISVHQFKGTKYTYKNTLWLLNYAAAYLDTTIRYSANEMILYMHRDALYLSKLCARSRAGGHYFLSDRHPNMTKPPSFCPLLKIPIHSISSSMTNFMGLAAEAKIGATYINGQEPVPIRTLIR